MTLISVFLVANRWPISQGRRPADRPRQGRLGRCRAERLRFGIYPVRRKDTGNIGDGEYDVFVKVTYEPV